jgi:hypothetical protein
MVTWDCKKNYNLHVFATSGQRYQVAKFVSMWLQISEHLIATSETHHLCCLHVVANF